VPKEPEFLVRAAMGLTALVAEQVEQVVQASSVETAAQVVMAVPVVMAETDLQVAPSPQREVPAATAVTRALQASAEPAARVRPLVTLAQTAFDLVVATEATEVPAGPRRTPETMAAPAA